MTALPCTQLQAASHPGRAPTGSCPTRSGSGVETLSVLGWVAILCCRWQSCPPLSSPGHWCCCVLDRTNRVPVRPGGPAFSVAARQRDGSRGKGRHIRHGTRRSLGLQCSEAIAQQNHCSQGHGRVWRHVSQGSAAQPLVHFFSLAISQTQTEVFTDLYNMPCIPSKIILLWWCHRPP